MNFMIEFKIKLLNQDFLHFFFSNQKDKKPARMEFKLRTPKIRSIKMLNNHENRKLQGQNIRGWG